MEKTMEHENDNNTKSRLVLLVQSPKDYLRDWRTWK